MPRTLAVLAFAIVLSTCVGFAAAKLSEPDQVRAKGDPSAKLLKQIEANTHDANILLGDIAYSTAATCRAVRQTSIDPCERR